MSTRPIGILLAVVAAQFLAQPVTADQTVTATPTTFLETLKAAVSGETIRLAPGVYEPIILSGRHWSPSVTVDAIAAELRGVRLGDISGLTWHGGLFDGGEVQPNGINVFRADHLVIDGATFKHFRRNGIGLGIVSDARITNNAIVDSGADGIDVAMSRRIVLDHNRCAEFHPTPGAHPDCIQLWSHHQEPPTADIVVSNNEAIGDMQGFTMFSNIRAMTGGPGELDGGYDRITVEHNFAKVTNFHGVAMYNCRHCVLRHNRAESLPNVKYPNTRAWIKVIGGEDITNCDNLAADWPKDPGRDRCRDGS